MTCNQTIRVYSIGMCGAHEATSQYPGQADYELDKHIREFAESDDGTPTHKRALMAMEEAVHRGMSIVTPDLLPSERRKYETLRVELLKDAKLQGARIDYIKRFTTDPSMRAVKRRHANRNFFGIHELVEKIKMDIINHGLLVDYSINKQRLTCITMLKEDYPVGYSGTPDNIVFSFKLYGIWQRLTIRRLLLLATPTSTFSPTTPENQTANGRQHVSHLCHNPWCINWRHLHLENGGKNNVRNYCHANPCDYEPPCLAPGKLAADIPPISDLINIDLDDSLVSEFDQIPLEWLDNII